MSVYGVMSVRGLGRRARFQIRVQGSEALGPYRLYDGFTAGFASTCLRGSRSCVFGSALVRRWSIEAY